MAKNIVIGKLDIDTQALVDGTQRTVKQIEQLREQQDKLTKKGKEASEQFLANESALKKLEAAHKSQLAAIAAQTTEEGKLVSMKKAVKAAVDEINRTENDYVSNNEKLIALKKQLNTTDDDYEARLAKINAKLQENNNWLKESGSEHAKLITTFNDYKQQVADSFNQINLLNGGLGGFISRAQEAGGTGPLLMNALNGMATGIGGMTKASLAFIATPIGAVIAALALVFALVQNAMNSSTESAGKITKIFTTFSTITSAVLKVLEPLGSFLIDGIAAGFELAGKAAEAAMGWIADGLSWLGFDSAAEGVRDFTEGIKATVAETESLKKAQENLAAQMALQEIANEKAKQQIDELIKKSEDQTLSEEERMNALEEAAKIEQENYNQRKKLADEAYTIAVREMALKHDLTEEEKRGLLEGGAAYAEKLMRVKGITQEELDTLKNAQVEKLRIAGEETQMLESQNSAKLKLEEDFQSQRAQKAAEWERKRQKMLDDAVTRQKLELDLYVAEQGVKARTMQEELNLAKKIAEKKRAIAQAEYDASEKSANDKLALDLANAEITNELAKAQMASAVSNAERELAEYKKNNATRLEDGKFLSEELYNEEKTRLENIAQKEREYQALRLKEGVITEQEYKDELAKIDEQKRTDTEVLDDQITKQKTAQAQANREIALANASTQYEEDMILEQERHDAEIAKLEERRNQGLITEQQFNILKENEEKKHADNEKEIHREMVNFKLGQSSKMFGEMSNLLGKESKAGKAFAIAQTTIDTYLAAQKAFTSQLIAGDPTSLVRAGAAAAGAVVSGLANVKKIMGTKESKTPKAEKGALFNIGGNRHSAGGTLFTGEDGTRFEAEQGELIGVMNRNAARHFMAFNNAFPAGSSSAPNYFANGGIVSREIAQQSMNMDELAVKIAEANRAIPAPVVAVEDIIDRGNSYVQVRDGANF